MRITVVCSVYPPAQAGEAAHAAHLCKHLVAAGQSVTLITSKIDGVTPEGEGFAINTDMKNWGWSEMRTLKRALGQSRPDAVLLIYLGPIYRRHPMITFLPTFCRGLKPRPVVISQFENTPGADPTTMEARLGRKLASIWAGSAGLEYRYGTLLRDSDAVITLCRPHLDVLAGFYPAVEKKSRVIPAPPLLEVLSDPDGTIRAETRRKLGYTDDDFVVSYFGFIYPQKGVETAIEAVSFAAAKVPNIKLLLIGGSPTGADQKDPGYAGRMRKMADDMGLASRATWTGHIAEETDVSRHLHASDVSLMPFVQGIRLNNSSCAVVTSHGLPVVASRGETLEPEFVDRENVLLFPAGNSRAAADALSEVANDPSLRQKLRSGAAAFSQGRSSWTAVIRQTLEVCRPAPAA
ncbi:glycosyltransferase family 4 protein [Humisphaera borealis]|uniref:Glycosyltransferase family 4 protein n=1 Tax=Humisphaera borealis TaxID=2807512 RepID=A0A7M2WQZ8_9BACT|nr:glycosyltransferase family 4 protein [Humisphaera borealis]QOV87967.1 glycosyltransferase family 4 protein [Humisphaera borealis]